MGPKPRISLENRGKIIALAEEQYPHREIAARVGCSHGAVGEIVRKHRLTGSVTDRKIPGRGRKTTARQDRLLVRKSLADRFKTAPQVKAEMLLEHGVDISTSTAQRRLRESGLHGRKARRKPRLSPAHKRARLEFARAHKDWTASQWAQVVFSDESRFLLHRSDGRVYVRRRVGEEFHAACIQETVKHGGGGIMFWGCINTRGVGFLDKVDGRLNAEGYIDVLENSVIPSLHYHGLHSNLVFQQDNAPCHTARIVKQWFNDQGMEVMKWPAQSPDLNPIENLWDQIATKVAEGNPSNNTELLTAVKAAWNALPDERLKTLFDSMRRRCEAVIAAKGGATRY